jgi:signal transduction histidine kinase
MVAIKTPVHVADLAAEPIYAEHRDPGAVAAVELGGVRTFLSVPMLKDNELIGAFILCRQKEVRRFTHKQIALVTNFAAQAVIAIENAQLLNELRRRTNELDRSVVELQRERNNRLMNLEAMVASIGHEVRQPLAGIVSNGGAAIRLLDQIPPNLEEARLALNQMVEDSHRASAVFDNIRALFGKADRGQEPIDVNELARDALKALREELKDHGIITHAELTSQLPLVMGHRGQLQEVFVNLVRNAIEAMDAVRDDNRSLHVRAEHHDNSTIIISVEESGPGVDPTQLDKIFDAFVTTKPHGMGLGLAICRMIVERHEGQLVALPANPRGSVSWNRTARRFDQRQAEARTDLETGGSLFAAHSGGRSVRGVALRTPASGEESLAHTTSRSQTVQGGGGGACQQDGAHRLGVAGQGRHLSGACACGSSVRSLAMAA